MEVQIQDILSSIRSEGIEKAAAEAEAIKAAAKQEAAAILAKAREEAAVIRDSAQREAELFRGNARLDAEQAKRDAVLSFKQEVQAEFERLLNAGVGKTLEGDALAALIKAALNGESPSDYTAEVQQVTESLQQALASELKAGLELRPAKAVRAGFRLAAKDGSGYFDCTDEEIGKMLLPFFRNAQL